MLQHLFGVDLCDIRYVTLYGARKVLTAEYVLGDPLPDLEVPLEKHHLEPREPEDKVHGKDQQEKNDWHWNVQVAADEKKTTIEGCEL